MKSEKRIPSTKERKENVLGNENGVLNQRNNSEEVEPQKKSITHTFRLFEELSSSFEKAVGDMNTTQTNLINEILKQYLHWAQFIINHESPFITFDSGTFLALIESVDDAKLETIVNEISNEAAIDFIKFRWKRVNFRNVVRYLELLSSYANIGSITIGPMNGGNGNGNGNGFDHNSGNNSEYVDGFEKYEVAVRHHLGRRWSTFLGMYISSLFKSAVPTVKTSYEISTKSSFIYLTMALEHE